MRKETNATEIMAYHSKTKEYKIAFYKVEKVIRYKLNQFPPDEFLVGRKRKKLRMCFDYKTLS